MKTIAELRKPFTFDVEEVSSRVSAIMDWDLDTEVFLHSKGFYLQRQLCWTHGQRKELINSILIGRHIPHFSVLQVYNKDTKEDTYQIIDGKQRLHAILSFVRGNFIIELEGIEYTFDELPEEYQKTITMKSLRYYRILDIPGKPYSDQFKIDWFTYINFAGTPQDKIHLEKINHE